jgi:Cytochrome c3
MRTRTTKKLAQRIDLNYFKRPTRYKRAKFWLTLLLPVIALIWIVWRTIAKDSRVYSSGRMSAAHAVLEKECATCHLQQAGAFSARAADSACLSCHDGPIHHEIRATPAHAKSVECSSCHSEHRGRINISAVSNQACTQCHANLDAVEPAVSHFPAHIHSFESGHPEFDATEKDRRDPGTIKLNHAIHMKPIRRGPNGPNVQLECSDCHRSSAVVASWPYADAKYTAANHSYSDQDEVLPQPRGTRGKLAPMTGRELMAPVKFATACASCHLLAFDKRFEEGVPHDKPEVVQTFVATKFREYIAAHLGELRVSKDPSRDLTGKPLAPDVRVLTPAQWIAERTADAEKLLWRKTCNQCHVIFFAQKSQPARIPQSASGNNRLESSAEHNPATPNIEHGKITRRWLPRAKFDHDAHRGFTCISCHEKARRSTESSDILLPGIATCQTCHAPGPDHAESRCFECHTYHDWQQRKEVTPKFTLPSLRTGGR